MINRFKKYLQEFYFLRGLPSLIALFGAWAGQGPKWMRRFLIPGLVMIYALITLKSFWAISIYFMSFAFSIGYGLVCPTDPKPSFLGKIAYKLFPNDQVKQNYLARGVVAFLISLSLICVPFLKNSWFTYLIGSVGILAIWIFVSWRDLGTTKMTLCGKEVNLLNVDILVYAVTGVMIFFIISGKLAI